MIRRDDTPTWGETFLESVIVVCVVLPSLAMLVSFMQCNGGN
jgi:hypothetical protein